MNKHRIMFDLMGMDHCCGMVTIGSFQQQQQYSWSREKVVILKTKEEVFKRFEEELFENLLEHIDGDRRVDGGGYLLACTLVEKYENMNDQQFPELAEYLLSSGWEIKNMWVNRNTGNTCALYTRFITDEEIRAIQPPEYRDDDDEDDDNDW